MVSARAARSSNLACNQPRGENASGQRGTLSGPFHGFCPRSTIFEPCMQPAAWRERIRTEWNTFWTISWFLPAQHGLRTLHVTSRVARTRPDRVEHFLDHFMVFARAARSSNHACNQPRGENLLRRSCFPGPLEALARAPPDPTGLFCAVPRPIRSFAGCLRHLFSDECGIAANHGIHRKF